MAQNILRPETPTPYSKRQSGSVYISNSLHGNTAKHEDEDDEDIWDESIEVLDLAPQDRNRCSSWGGNQLQQTPAMMNRASPGGYPKSESPRQIQSTVTRPVKKGKGKLSMSSLVGMVLWRKLYMADLAVNAKKVAKT